MLVEGATIWDNVSLKYPEKYEDPKWRIVVTESLEGIQGSTGQNVDDWKWMITEVS